MSQNKKDWVPRLVVATATVSVIALIVLRHSHTWSITVLVAACILLFATFALLTGRKPAKGRTVLMRGILCAAWVPIFVARLVKDPTDFSTIGTGVVFAFALVSFWLELHEMRESAARKLLRTQTTSITENSSSQEA